MDPQPFVRLSIGSLGLRVPIAASKAVRSDALSSPCTCEIRLRGFPMQVAPVPLINSPEEGPDPHSFAASFYLEESNLRALLSHSCFQAANAHLEIAVFSGREGGHCGISSRKQQIGAFKLQAGSEWTEGKAVSLHNGWTVIGKNKHDGSKPGVELHVRVRLDPDPRFVFQFEGETTSSPQIVHLQGNSRQPIFSCKFLRERRASQSDPLSSYWPTSSSSEQENERRERKGWRVMIHDLSGSVVAAASMVTPFVPSADCDRVARSNPGAWLILHPDPGGIDTWRPWGRLEAWRERNGKDSIGCRFHLIEEGGCSLAVAGGGVLVSEILISAEKGGEFFIDTTRQTPVPTPLPSPQSSGDFVYYGHDMSGGFVMNCHIQGESRSSKPVVHLATRHVKCVEDAAIFMALAAAVDLSREACRPFRRRLRHHTSNSF
ncbi:hypothetical protein EJ110_NYTH11976 [Nymphaea thermarum]|nr:hypothetical protein EJ110_NYTH11976 [Nymphaea thermarum]